LNSNEWIGDTDRCQRFEPPALSPLGKRQNAL